MIVFLQMKEEEISHLKRYIDRLEKEQATSKSNMQEEMKLQVSLSRVGDMSGYCLKIQEEDGKSVVEP